MAINPTFNLSTIKGITIPEGSVKQITDSNGVILWKAVAGTPSLYRQLEYIQFSGAEYIDPNLSVDPRTGTPDGMLIELSADISTTDQTYVSGTTTYSILGSKNRPVSATREIKLDFQRQSSRIGYFIRYGAAGDYSSMASNVSGTILNHTNGMATWLVGITSDATEPWVWYKDYDLITSWDHVKNSTDDWSFSNIYLMARGDDSSGTLVANQFTVGKIYRLKRTSVVMQSETPTWTNTSYTGNNRDYVPCQRKSDGLCGLWDLNHDVFYPMQGSAITTAAAGPTARENPDWSPKLVYDIAGGTGAYALTAGQTTALAQQTVISNIPEDIVNFKVSATVNIGANSQGFTVPINRTGSSTAYSDNAAATRTLGNEGQINYNTANTFICSVYYSAGYTNHTYPEFGVKLQYNKATHSIIVSQYISDVPSVYRDISLSNIHIELS